jgi:hypothetical protein
MNPFLPYLFKANISDFTTLSLTYFVSTTLIGGQQNTTLNRASLDNTGRALDLAWIGSAAGHHQSDGDVRSLEWGHR